MWVGKYSDNNELSDPLTFTQRFKGPRRKPQVKKSNKLFIPILGFIFVLTILGGLYYFYRPSFNFPSLSKVAEDKKEPEYVNIESYYVAQTNFKALRESIKLEDLKTESLYFSRSIRPEEIDELKVLLGIEEIQVIEAGFDSFQTVGADSVFVTYPSESDYRLKTLDIDGNSLWSKSSVLENYPLKSNIKLVKQNESTLATEINFAKTDVIDLFVGGEIIASRAVDRLWLNKSNNNIQFLFERLQPHIKNADIALGMVENSYSGNPTPCQGCVVFVSDEGVLPGYKEVGFDVFSLATNHEGDGGAKAAANTRKLLDDIEINHFGSGTNLAEAQKPSVIEANGTKFAFIGGDDVGYFYWAGPAEEGTNYFSKRSSSGAIQVDNDKITAEVKAAKEQADVVVVMMTWGIEYQNKATSHQEEMAKAFVDAGADLIVSSHPHWVQNAELITAIDGRKVPVFYSLGNFIFDQTHTDPTRQAIVTEFSYYKGKLADINIIPFQVCGYHQTQNNVANKVISGELTYEQVDAMGEKNGCVWWQPNPVKEGTAVYETILNRLFEHTEF